MREELEEKIKQLTQELIADLADLEDKAGRRRLTVEHGCRFLEVASLQPILTNIVASNSLLEAYRCVLEKLE